MFDTSLEKHCFYISYKYNFATMFRSTSRGILVLLLQYDFQAFITIIYIIIIKSDFTSINNQIKDFSE